MMLTGGIEAADGKKMGVPLPAVVSGGAAPGARLATGDLAIGGQIAE